MAIPTPGLAVQNFDINKTIEKLVAVKREPLQRIENEMEALGLQKEVWDALRKRLANLGDMAKHLYDYTSPFGALQAESGDPASFTAVAERGAVEGEHRVQVLQTAQAERISSDSIRRDQRLPGSVFTIESGGKKAKIDFSFGGTLADLKTIMDANAKEIARISLANNTLDTAVMVLEAQKGGPENGFRFDGDLKTLIEAGFLGNKGAEDIAVPFTSGWAGYRGARLDRAGFTVEDGALLLAPGKRFEYALPKRLEAADGWTARFTVRFDAAPRGGEEPAAEPQEERKPIGDVQLGPKELLRIEGLSIDGNRLLSGLDMEPEAPLADTKEPASSDEETPDTKVFLLVQENGQRTEFAVPVSFADGSWQEAEVPLKNIAGLASGARLVLANDNTAINVRFRDISFQKNGEDGNGFKNQLAAPRESILTMDGVEIRRPENAVTDAIPGVTLKLIKAGEEADLRVHYDADMIARDILSFIEAYNQTIVYMNAVSTALTREEKEKLDREMKNKSELMRALEDKDKADEDRHRGKLAGEMVMNQLKSSMSTIMMSAYDTRLKRELALLLQAGISTGKPGASWDDLRKASGTLELDTAALNSIIERDVIALSQLFGSDSTGNQVVDQGAAFKLFELLRTYTQPGNAGVIAGKTRTIDRTVSDKKKSLERGEASVKAYEEQLRNQFATMETQVREYQERGKWLNRATEGGNR
ncbi:MAG: flagellar filament capping protein FliD [Spirochaetota bacterium]|jgi:flagellar hook-associated protein 2|nr:flagellar filament capping protein FliD [Spirochaetota bacterium]